MSAAKSMKDDGLAADPTFKNTLHNLDLDMSKLHSEDLDALHKAWNFFEYKGKRARMHAV